METLFDRLGQLGMSGASVPIVKNLNAGRLFVYDINEDPIAFQFIDKTFAEADVLRFIAALDARGVSIEVGK